MMPCMLREILPSVTPIRVVWLSFLVISTRLTAQSSDRIQLSSSPTLAQLVELCAEQYAVDIEYNPADLSKKLTLRPADGYTPDQLWELTHQMLEAAGSTTVLAPGDRRLYRIVKITDAGTATAPLEQIPHPPPGYAVFRYPISAADPAAVLAAFNDAKPPIGQASVAPGGQAVLVGALTRRHAEIQTIVSTIETEAASTRRQVVEARHADSVSLVAAVNAAKEQLPGRKLHGTLGPGPRPGTVLLTAPAADEARWLELIAGYDLPPVATVRSYSLPGFGADDLPALLEDIAKDPSPRGSGAAWRVVRNNLTATLLVTATPDEHARVAELLAQIESVPVEHLRTTRTFIIRNRNAEDLRGSLSRLLGVSLGEPASAPDPLRPADSPTTATALRSSSPSTGLSSSGLLMAVDPEMNAIIATGTPRELDQINELLQRLDIRQPQVQLEIMLVSLSEGQSQDLGVELQARLGDSGTLFGLGSLFGLSSVSPGSTAPTVGGSGGTAVILDPGDYSVVVKALETVSKGRSISRASTLVNNNESASISNTVNQPYATTTLDDGDSITGFGGSEAAGTTISVSPQIAEGDFLVLDYNVSLSAFLGEATSDGLPPPSQSTSLNSVATIPDGYAIAVGGLELITESDADSKTPGLADIPILGNLFKSSSESGSRTRFYLFIRASVLRSPGFERLRYLSDEAGREAQVDLGWPTVEPQIIR
jgi:type II secretory pathway component GspD/PulD (secretin)